MSSILIVDDEAGVRASLAGVLRDEGYTVATVDSGEACLAHVVQSPPDVILLDIWLPGMDGLATLERLRERNVEAQVIMISGHASVEAAVRSTKLGAFDFIEKPLSLDKTVLTVRNALRQHRLKPKIASFARVDRRLVIVAPVRSWRSCGRWSPWPRPPTAACSFPARTAPARNSWRARSTR
jgi:two-component system nitrogen regulation response regulator NtrX